jgi:PAS domain S-box-containing protein
VSDILIWLAYLSIPLVLGFFARRRRIRPFTRVAWLFAAFILACGFTHLLEAVTFYTPVYRLAGAVKLFTAGVSWATVLALIPTVPWALALIDRLPELSRLEELPQAPVGRRWQYVRAVLAAILVMLVRQLLDPLLEGNPALTLPLLAVMFVAWAGGFGPALVTLLLSLIGFTVLFLEPRGTLTVGGLSDQLALGLFVFCGVGAALLGEAQQHARRQADRTVADLAHANRELHHAQQQTAELLAQLDTFLLNAPVGIGFFDPELRFVRVNRHLAEANGRSVTDHLGRPVLEVVPDMPPDVIADFHRVLDTGEAILNRPVAVPTEEGPVTWQINIFPVRQPGGRSFGLGVIGQNVTDRLRAEAELKASEERFRTLAEAVPQVVWMAGPDGRHEYYNSRWQEMTGLAPAESLGDGWLTALHAQDRARAGARWREAISHGEPYEMEYRYRTAEGGVRWFLTRAVPVRDPAGAVVRWFGTSTDIDDQKRQAERLEELVRERTANLSLANQALQAEVDERTRAEERANLVARELRQSNEELEKFAYVASHDLQEPLRKIQAFGDRLAQRLGKDANEQVKDYLGRMQNAATRMRRLIDDLLTFSRVTTKGQPLAAVDLAEVVKDTLSDLEERINQTQARIAIGPLPTVTADRLQMHQLFLNLVGNALKFHKPNAPATVAITATRFADLPTAAAPPPTAAGWRFEVRDQGIGFAQEYAGRIFDLFQRLHGRTEYEGTGIGLAICRKIVERHGGTIRAESQPGVGATFVIDLPDLAAAATPGSRTHPG